MWVNQRVAKKDVSLFKGSISFNWSLGFTTASPELGVDIFGAGGAGSGVDLKSMASSFPTT